MHIAPHQSAAFVAHIAVVPDAAIVPGHQVCHHFAYLHVVFVAVFSPRIMREHIVSVPNMGFQRVGEAQCLILVRFVKSGKFVQSQAVVRYFRLRPCALVVGLYLAQI